MVVVVVAEAVFSLVEVPAVDTSGCGSVTYFGEFSLSASIGTVGRAPGGGRKGFVPLCSSKIWYMLFTGSAGTQADGVGFGTVGGLNPECLLQQMEPVLSILVLATLNIEIEISILCISRQTSFL